MPFKLHFIDRESDITIISDQKNAIERAKSAFYRNRSVLEHYISLDQTFLTTFSPIKVKSDKKIVNLMVEAADKCDVGPMAAVAGALADLMLEEMKTPISGIESDFISPNIALVENGGEIAIDTTEPLKIALYAGFNELNLNLGFLVDRNDSPLGIGTSSSTFGHAVSLGQADVVTIFAENACLADAAATRICNLVKGNDIEYSIKRGLDAVNDIGGVYGAFISRENKIGQTGRLPKLIKIEGNKEQILTKKLNDPFLGEFEVFK